MRRSWSAAPRRSKAPLSVIHHGRDKPGHDDWGAVLSPDLQRDTSHRAPVRDQPHRLACRSRPGVQACLGDYLRARLAPDAPNAIEKLGGSLTALHPLRARLYQRESAAMFRCRDLRWECSYGHFRFWTTAPD